MGYAILLQYWLMVAGDFIRAFWPWALLVGFIFGAGWLTGGLTCRQ